MKMTRKLTAFAAATGLLVSAAVAQAQSWWFPTDKPIYNVTYYTDGSAEPQVYGVYVIYCDLTTYQDGSITLFPQIVPYDECG
jgi:hypothetical protein